MYGPEFDHIMGKLKLSVGLDAAHVTKSVFRSANNMTSMEIPVKIIRLLIVDDHQMVRDGIRTMLESKENFLKFEIDEAENGEVALQKVLKKEYDIVLMDYQLPGMNGTETLQQIRLYKKDLRVLALS